MGKSVYLCSLASFPGSPPAQRQWTVKEGASIQPVHQRNVTYANTLFWPCLLYG